MMIFTEHSKLVRKGIFSGAGGTQRQNASVNRSLVKSLRERILETAIDVRNHTDVHEVTAIGANTLTYDFKGNLATNGGNTQDYIWDAENRMQSIGNSVDADYRYDALGRRVQKAVTVGAVTTTTTFVCGGSQVFTEYVNAVEKQSYVYASYVDDAVALIAANGDTSFYHQNHLFSTEVMTDNLGAVVEYSDYNSYGKVTLRDNLNNVITSSTVGNSYYFTGRRLDAESGLYYFRARYFDVDLGRFIARDPLGYVDGLGMYSGYFVPNGVDPTGMIEPKTKTVKWEEESRRYTHEKKLVGKSWWENHGRRDWTESTFINRECTECDDSDMKYCWDNVLEVEKRAFLRVEYQSFEVWQTDTVLKTYYTAVFVLQTAGGAGSTAIGVMESITVLTPGATLLTSAETAMATQAGLVVLAGGVGWSVGNYFSENYFTKSRYLVASGSAQINQENYNEIEMSRKTVKKNYSSEKCPIMCNYTGI